VAFIARKPLLAPRSFTWMFVGCFQKWMVYNGKPY